MISILHPSRSRPQQAKETSRKWLANAGCDIEYILSIDLDDRDLPEYEKLFGNSIITIGANRSAVDAINRAARISTGNILLVLSDDFECSPMWGKQILDFTQGKKDWIMKTMDGTQGWIITIPIMDRTYYDRFNYIYFSEYLHMFCDTEITAVADLLERKIESRIAFHHNHYSVKGGVPKDIINERANKTWAQGEKLFIERYKRNFDLVNPPGKITSQQYLNWIKGKL